jgi:hypothetical protein
VLASIADAEMSSALSLSKSRSLELPFS